MILTYMDYMDLDTGRVLLAEPGGTYNIQAVGFGAPDVPPNDFTKITDAADKDDEDEELITYDPAPEAVEE